MADWYLWDDGYNSVDDFATRTVTATPVADAVAAAADTDTLNFKAGSFVESGLIELATKRLNLLGANDGIDPVENLADRQPETIISQLVFKFTGSLDWSGYRFSGFTFDGRLTDIPAANFNVYPGDSCAILEFFATSATETTGEFIYENNIHKDNAGQLWKVRVTGSGDPDADGEYEVYKQAWDFTGYYYRNAKGYVLVSDWSAGNPFTYKIYDGETAGVLGTELYTGSAQWFQEIINWAVVGGAAPAPSRAFFTGWTTTTNFSTTGVWGGLSFRYRNNRDIRNQGSKSFLYNSNGSVNSKFMVENNHITTQYGVSVANGYAGSYVRNNTFKDCFSYALNYQCEKFQNGVDLNNPIGDISDNVFIDCAQAINLYDWNYIIREITGNIDYVSTQDIVIERNEISTNLSKQGQAFNRVIETGGVRRVVIRDNTITLYGNISETPSYPQTRYEPPAGEDDPESCMVGIDIRGFDSDEITIEGNVIDSGSPQGTFDFPTPGLYIRNNDSFYGPLNPELELVATNNDLNNWQSAILVNGNDYPVPVDDYVDPEVTFDLKGNRFDGSLFGADNAPAPSAVLDCRECWWGADSGPSGGVTDPAGNIAVGDGAEVTVNVLFGNFVGSQAPIPVVCLGQGGAPGEGGVGSGGTDSPGQSNTGSSSNTGYPVLALVTEMDKTLPIALYDTLIGETPSDLQALGVVSLEFKAKEMIHHQVYYIEKSIPIPAPPREDGLVFLDFDPDEIPYAGMWYASVIGRNSLGYIVAEWPMWLEIRKSLDQTVTTNNPINIAEVRLVLRDSVPEANELLLEYEFSDTEIAFNIMRPIEEWNEALPPVQTFTGATFPYREHWRKATAGYLMRTAARKYLRDDLQYSAGGLSVNDKRKWDAYEKLGQQLIDEWRSWMKQEKVRLNSLKCYGNIGSAAFGGWRVH